ncbi:hypothetical protein CKO27_03540 [Thiocystis violacea]|nr:hypothetical protein [Thiocystis violacea]
MLLDLLDWTSGWSERFVHAAMWSLEMPIQSRYRCPICVDLAAMPQRSPFRPARFPPWGFVLVPRNRAGVVAMT